MRNIRLYGHFLRVAILGKAQYKADFFVGIISVLNSECCKSLSHRYSGI